MARRREHGVNTRFAVAVLNWNGAEVLPAMLRSVLPQVEELGGRLIVLDNGSTDSSADDIEREFGDTGCFSLLRSPANLGFSRGANLLLQEINEEIAVLANSDTVFLKNSLKTLLEAFQRHERAGLIGPMLLWPEGELQPSMRDFPFPGKLIREHLPIIRRGSAKYGGHCTERRADWLVGAVMAIRMEAFRSTGGFDERYFIYHEETDLQYRMSQRGWEIWFVPDAKVVHVEGASTRKMYGRTSYLQYIPAKLRFLRKNGYSGSVSMFRVYMLILQMTRLLIGCVNSRKRNSDVRYTPSYCRRALSLIWTRDSGKQAAPEKMEVE
jgi:hypothetical protein